VALTTHHSLHEVDPDEISPARDGPETQLPTTWSIIISSDVECLSYPKTPKIRCHNKDSTQLAQAGDPR